MSRTSRSAHLLFLSFGVVAAVLGYAQETKDRPFNEPKKSLEEVKAMPPGAAAAVDPKTYKIGPEDIILIQVWREPDLTRPVMVRPDGKISMPLIGELDAAGQTPEELGKGITDALLKHMNRPEVFISVQQVNSKKFYIVGEVVKAGPYNLVTPTTVMEALSAAGGLREFANKKKIIVIRGSKRFVFNYKEFLAGKNLKQNIMVESGDQIVVE